MNITQRQVFWRLLIDLLYEEEVFAYATTNYEQIYKISTIIQEYRQN